MSTVAVLRWNQGTEKALSYERKGPVTCGGAKGTRTPNPLLAKCRTEHRSAVFVLLRRWELASLVGQRRGGCCKLLLQVWSVRCCIGEREAVCREAAVDRGRSGQQVVPTAHVAGISV